MSALSGGDAWALSAEQLRAFDQMRAAALQNAGLVADLQAKFGRTKESAYASYSREGEGTIAVLPMVGVLVKRPGPIERFLGAISTDDIEATLREVAVDPSISGIVLEIDSPGGQVAGVEQLAQRIHQVRADGKPVWAWITGVGASGAYWIASAAERVLIADPTTVVGSIGVVASHVDVSEREKTLGIRTTEVTAGKYKRIASNYAPLTAEGRQTLQDQVDALYSVFVNSVALNRKTTPQVVQDRMADGRVFIGADAVRAGLVDGVASLEDVIAALAAPQGAAARGGVGAGPNALDAFAHTVGARDPAQFTEPFGRQLAARVLNEQGLAPHKPVSAFDMADRQAIEKAFHSWARITRSLDRRMIFV